MIASLRGEIVAVSSSACVVDVGGVGYAVSLTPAHTRQLHIGDESHFLTRLIVREDAMQLFGFESESELTIFDALLTVSGIGPRSALAVLSHLSPREIYAAVVAEDDAPFRNVSGIGPKTAKLVVVSLAGRLTHLLGDELVETHVSNLNQDSASSAMQTQVVAALVGLGWNEKHASETVVRVLSSSTTFDSAALLRASLSELGSPGVGS